MQSDDVIRDHRLVVFKIARLKSTCAQGPQPKPPRANDGDVLVSLIVRQERDCLLFMFAHRPIGFHLITDKCLDMRFARERDEASVIGHANTAVLFVGRASR